MLRLIILMILTSLCLNGNDFLQRNYLYKVTNAGRIGWITYYPEGTNTLIRLKDYELLMARTVPADENSEMFKQYKKHLDIVRAEQIKSERKKIIKAVGISAIISGIIHFIGGSWLTIKVLNTI